MSEKVLFFHCIALVYFSLNLGDVPRFIMSLMVIALENTMPLFTVAIVLFFHWRIRAPSYQILTKIDRILNFIILIFFQIFLFIISGVVICIEFFVLNECSSDNNLINPSWYARFYDLIVSNSFNEHVISLDSMCPWGFIHFLLDNFCKIIFDWQNGEISIIRIVT